MSYTKTLLLGCAWAAALSLGMLGYFSFIGYPLARALPKSWGLLAYLTGAFAPILLVAVIACIVADLRARKVSP